MRYYELTGRLPGRANRLQLVAQVYDHFGDGAHVAMAMATNWLERHWGSHWYYNGQQFQTDVYDGSMIVPFKIEEMNVNQYGGVYPADHG